MTSHCTHGDVLLYTRLRPIVWTVTSHCVQCALYIVQTVHNVMSSRAHSAHGNIAALRTRLRHLVHAVTSQGAHGYITLYPRLRYTLFVTLYTLLRHVVQRVTCDVVHMVTSRYTRAVRYELGHPPTGPYTHRSHSISDVSSFNTV